MFNRETRSTMGTMFWISMMSIVIIIIASAVYLFTLQPAMNLERNALQSSNQYVQSKVTEITDLNTQWNRLEVEVIKYQDNPTMVTGLKAQEQAVVNQACNAYNLLSAPEAVNNNLRNWLVSNGCR